MEDVHDNHLLNLLKEKPLALLTDEERALLKKLTVKR
jgi:DNA primase